MKTITKETANNILKNSFPNEIFILGKGMNDEVCIRIQDKKWLFPLKNLFNNYSNIDIQYIGKIKVQ